MSSTKPFLLEVFKIQRSLAELAVSLCEQLSASTAATNEILQKQGAGEQDSAVAEYLEREGRTLSTISNVIKALRDLQEGVIGNLK